MALTSKNLTTREHFKVRVAGLSALLILAAAVMLLAVTGGWLLLVPIVAAVLVAGFALVVEIQQGVGRADSRRGALGSNVFLQILLAVLLVVGVNVYAFDHYQRFDWTREHEFNFSKDPSTNAKLRDMLGQLRGETRIVVYQMHNAFGQGADKQAHYAAAAERKIVEKVKDLAEQFQDLGPRFQVEVLDNQEFNFPDRLASLKKDVPQLAQAIESAPEDSIFFFAEGKVQRLGFHDIYQLDKKASVAAAGGKGNLVLRYQGIEPFARKVLYLDEKKPRIALGVVHEVLGMDNNDEVNQALSMAAAKKALTSRGFETRDIILKKWKEDGPPEPAVLTYGESRFEQYEEQLAELDATIKSLQDTVRDWSEQERFWKQPLEEINKRYVIVVDDDEAVLLERAEYEAVTKKLGRKLPTLPVKDTDKERILQRRIGPQLTLLQLRLGQEQKERKEVADKQAALDVEDLSEQRRITDLRAKMKRMLADCDLLILPRMTLFNVSKQERIPNAVYRLDNAQLEAIKDFMRAGKPVLFCLGPSNDAGGRFNPFEDGAGDGLEQLLGDLNFRLPKQTILFNAETKSFGERRGALFILGSSRVEVPPVEFDWRTDGRPSLLSLWGGKLANPIRTSLDLAARAVGDSQSGDLRLRHPRPVYYEPRHGQRLTYDPVFLMTSPDAWNETDPFPTTRRTPRYEPPKADDRDKGTVNEKRSGQFPIGVAATVTVPADGDDKEPAAGPGKVRVAVIGHGGVFMGPNLTPVREKLLLDVSDWLLGRDELLARDDRTWEYPRVALSDTGISLWHWGTFLGLPFLFAYIGCVVLLVRHMR